MVFTVPFILLMIFQFISHSVEHGSVERWAAAMSGVALMNLLNAVYETRWWKRLWEKPNIEELLADIEKEKSS